MEVCSLDAAETMLAGKFAAAGKGPVCRDHAAAHVLAIAEAAQCLHFQFVRSRLPGIGQRRRMLGHALVDATEREENIAAQIVDARQVGRLPQDRGCGFRLGEMGQGIVEPVGQAHGLGEAEPRLEPWRSAARANALAKDPAPSTRDRDRSGLADQARERQLVGRRDGQIQAAHRQFDGRSLR